MQLSNSKAKNKIIQIRVTENERDYLKKEASKRGLTVSELIKKSLDSYLNND